MTGNGACNGDMPTFPRPVPGGIPPVGDPVFDALLDKTLAAHDAPAGLRPLAEAFAALDAAPAQSQPAAEANALTAFRGAVSGRPAQPADRRPRRHPVLTSLVSVKVAAAAMVAAVAVGGTAAAAFTGQLPSPAQKLAHDTIGAPMTPSARPAHTEVAHPAPSSLPGRSAFGLCTAWQHMQASGSAAQKATAFRRLEAAAGGASQVSSFCAGVTHPGGGSSAKSPAHPSGKPAAKPSHRQNPQSRGQNPQWRGQNPQSRGQNPQSRGQGSHASGQPNGDS
jgi:hypothetical protein